MIRLSQVGKSWDGGKNFALRGLDLEVAPGEMVALIGASGCGKSTTLKLINRLVEPTEGTVHVKGQEVKGADPVQLRRAIGYVSQQAGLFPHWTVAENVGVVPRLLGWPAADVAARIDELLELVGLPPGLYRDRRPSQMSGGEQQRVGGARALAGRPKILLLDEPFGALDPSTRDRLQEETRALHERLGLTTVLVTHDMAEALLLADQVVVMDSGRIVRKGPPAELLAEPGDPVVQALISTPRRHAQRIDDLLGKRT
jgi:osmoprotectant transport system ATP-binding protein